MKTAILAGVAVCSLLPAAITLRAGAREPQDARTLENAFYKVCGDCHEPDRIRERRRTRGGWEEVIEVMIQKGAVGTDQDFILALQYLLVNYGMVNMNQAPADEIAIVTGVSLKDAEAIVAYRKEKGNFRNYDALIQVPGIDVKPLEEHRASMMF